MFDIFEQPWTLVGAAVVALIVVWIIQAILPDKKQWSQWALPVLIAVAAFGLDALVQTDSEKIVRTIDNIVEAAQSEDCQAISETIAADYQDSSHTTKERLMRYCGVVLSEPLIKKNIKSILSTEVSGQKAIVVLTVRVVFDKESKIYNFRPLMLVKMELTLQKQQNNNWLISRAELLEIDRQPVKWNNVKTFSW